MAQFEADLAKPCFPWLISTPCVPQSNAPPLRSCTFSASWPNPAGSSRPEADHAGCCAAAQDMLHGRGAPLGALCPASCMHLH